MITALAPSEGRVYLRFIMLGGGLMLGGCATVETAPPGAGFPAIYPAVSIFLNGGNIWVTSTEEDGDEVTELSHEAVMLKEELERLGLFRAVNLVDTADAPSARDMVFAVRYEYTQIEQDPWKWIVSLGSAFLIPTVWTCEASIQVEIRVKSELVRSFAYRIRVEDETRLFARNDAGERGAVTLFWARFVADAQNANVLTRLPSPPSAGGIAGPDGRPDGASPAAVITPK